MQSSSYISIDPIISIQRVDPFRTSSQPWTNDSVKSSYTSSSANSHRLDYSSTTISDNHNHYSNNTFHSIQPYQERLYYPECCRDDSTKHYSYISKPDYERSNERIKENLPYWSKLDQQDYSNALGSNSLSERKPFQDLTNLPTGYGLSSQNDFKSRALNMESSYIEEEDKRLIERLLRREDVRVNELPSMVQEQLPTKEADMTHNSRPIVYNIGPEQNKRVSYFSDIYQTASPMVDLDPSYDLKVNNIMGKKKGKSVSLIRRNRPGLDIDTSYNSNGHIMIFAADDGMTFKNLMHDSYTTRAGFLEVKRR